jgi:metallo-beta-lactamase class B
MTTLNTGLARVARFVAILASPLPLLAQNSAAPRRTEPCASCAEWNIPQRPFRLYGNTYFVGTHGLSAILIVSPNGDVLIDGGLPESAPIIIANVRALGYRIEDVKLILNSHAHFDHAGGLAELQRASGATVAASPWSARVLSSGTTGRGDPQYGILASFPPAHDVKVIADGDTLRVGPIAMTAHFTPGHTPGGTSWSWRSCDGERCLDFVYADSQTPVSADDFFFTRSTTYPSAIADFDRGFTALERLRCDVLLTPHPDASSLWERVAARDSGRAQPALEDPAACKRFVANAREQLAQRIAKETGKP